MTPERVFGIQQRETLFLPTELAALAEPRAEKRPVRQSNVFLLL